MKTYENSKRVKNKIDKILVENDAINTDASGTDVPKYYKAEAKRKIKENAKKIKEIDLEFYNSTYKIEV